jgi:NADPH-dependent ferric siderophore reductase
MDAEAAKPRKQRPPPKEAFIDGIEHVTPGVIRISCSGPELAAFMQPKPAGHIKLFFPPEGVVWPSKDPASDIPRPPSRTYTPRRFDAARHRLEIEFVRHGEGLASSWAERARIGERVLIGGPGGGYPVPEDARHLVIIADESAMPGAGMVLEALPPECRAQVICEVASKTEERALSPIVACEPLWLHRTDKAARPGALLEEAVRAMPAPASDTFFWVACEAAAMRRIRDILIAHHGVERARLHMRGYWKFGEANHPDHDYGAD